ncbi:nucleic acid-binding, OB-fold protein [Tanacetum coccineum]
MCTATSNYQQTLDTETTLQFGRYTNFVNIPADAFPKHYFNFTSYNQLGTKIQRQDTVTGQRQPTLTGSNITIVRKLDIENLKFVERFNLHPPLEISKTKFEDLVKEKDRNRYPLSTLLQQNPDTYRGVRFTASITVVGINTARDWYYESCSKCPRKIEDGDETGICPDHGPQPILAYRYNFKAFVSDQSATTAFTFFNPNADVLTGYECSELLKKYNMPSPRNFPTEILSLKGRQHIFQFHFNPYSVTGKVDFYFDDILDKPLQITETDMPALETAGESSGIETGLSIPEKTLQLAIGTITESKTNIPTTDPSFAVTGTPTIVSLLEDLAG